MFWAISLDTCHVGSQRIYLWREMLDFTSLNNNMRKEKQLTIDNGGLPRMSGEKISFNCHFEANIIIIWQFNNLTIYNGKE